MRQPNPAVRRQACSYLVDHPSPKHASILLPALRDPHSEIVHQAIRALGLGGGLDDLEPLKQMLGTSSESLRVEAATALARLGDPAGPPALERLAHSSDVTVRRQAAAAMGQTPNPAYQATLTGLLNDQYSVRLAAADSLAKVTGADDAASVPDKKPTTGETVGHWKPAKH